ncbi:hypothetical protein pb186bvf_019973 [Paramecium bursaria]
MNSQRFCCHQNNICTYVCTFKDCHLRRWVCSECFRLQLHQHGQQSDELQHIVNHQGFIKYFTKQINPLKSSIFKQYKIARQAIDQLNHIIELLRKIIVQLQTDIHNIWIYNDMINLQALQDQIKNDFYSLEKEQIIKIQQLNVLENCYEFKVMKQILEQVKAQIDELSLKIHTKPYDIQKNEPLISNKQGLQREQSIFKTLFNIPKLLEASKQINLEKSLQTLEKSKTLEMTNRKGPQINNDKSLSLQQSFAKLVQSALQINQLQIGQVQDFNIYLDYKQISCINTSSLSQNEKILAISSLNRIKIYEMTSLTNIFILELDSPVTVCKFSKDSKLIFCGDVEGNLYSFETDNSFKLQYKFKIHKSIVNNLIIINDQNVITSSQDQTIIITNVKSNKIELFIENTNTLGLDYNKHTNVICSTNSKEINFYHRNGSLIFKRDYIDSDAIRQIQFMNENRLISRSQIRFMLWQVNYGEKWMAKVREFKYEMGILNIFSGLNDKRILIVTTFYSEIYDDKLDFIQRIDINEYQYFDNQTCQIDSLNYILIPSQSIQLFFQFSTRLIISSQKEFKMIVIISFEVNHITIQIIIIILKMLILVILGIVTSLEIRQNRPCPNIQTFQYDEWDLKQQCPNMDRLPKLTYPPPEQKCRNKKEPDFLFDVDKKPDLLQMALNIMQKERQQIPKKIPKRVDFKQKHEQEYEEFVRKQKQQKQDL